MYDTDAGNLSERYLSGANAGDLTAMPDAAATPAAPVARGKSRVGAMLLRLHSQWDNSTDRGLTVTRAFPYLTAWPEVRISLMGWADASVEAPGSPSAEVLVADVVAWWLDGQCVACRGRKFETGPRHQRACGSCHGSGKARLPHEWNGRALLSHMESCVFLARAGIKARIAQTKGAGLSDREVHKVVAAIAAKALR